MSTKKDKSKIKINRTSNVSAKSIDKRSYTKWIEFLVIFFLVFITYGNSINNDYNIDDGYVVSLDKGNKLTKEGIFGIPEILTSNYSSGPGITYGYRPFGKITMAVEYSLWGNNPHYSHVVNLLLFVINVFLLLLFFKKLASFFKYNNLTVIYLSILLFIIHPIHTEVVCSIKNREEILCYIFSLLSIFAYFKVSETKEWKYYIYFFCFVILAFLSKQTAANIFSIIFIIIFFRELVFANPYIKSNEIEHKESYAGILIEMIKANKFNFSVFLFLIIISLMFDFMHIFTFIGLFLISNLLLRNNHSGAANFLKSIFGIKNIVILVTVSFLFNLVFNFIPAVLPESDLGNQFESNPYFFYPASHSFPNGIQTIIFYIKKMIIPFPLLFYYGYNMLPDQGWNSIYPFIGFIGFFGIAYSSWYNIKRKQHLFFVFFVLFLFVTIFPFSNLFKNIYITGIVGERLIYQATAPFCFLLVYGVDFLASFIAVKFKEKNLQSGYIVYVIMAVIVIPYFLITVQRNKQWLNKATLYSHDIKYLANSARANFIYAGNIMSRLNKETNPVIYQAELQKANMYFHNSLAIYPKFDRALLEMGNVYIAYLNNKDSALYYYNKVDSLPNKYTYVRARELIGSIYYADSNLTKALVYFDEAFKLYTGNLPLYKEMVIILLKTKQYDRILTLSDTAINNNWPEGYANKGDAFLNKLDTAAAMDSYEKALENGFRNEVLMKNLDYYYKLKGARQK